MRLDGLRVGSRPQSLLGLVKSRTGLPHHLSGRFALCLSLGEAPVPNPDEFDSNGLEIRTSDLFGEYEDVFMALLGQRLVDDGLDTKHLPEMARAHLNRGIVALYARLLQPSDIAGLVADRWEGGP